MDISRRNFILGGLGLAGYLSQPELWSLAAQAANLAPRKAGESKVLVVVQLTGGNDGLNTVVPYNDGSYYQVRPSLAIKPNEVIAITDQLGLHPNMKALADLYKDNKIAIVQGVGYPNSSRSHFRSMEIWQTAEPTKLAENGWLGRYLDLAVPVSGSQSDNPLPAVNVDPMLPMSLMARKVVVPSVANISDFRFKTDPRYVDDRKAQLTAFKDIYRDFDLKKPNVDLLRSVGLDAADASEHLVKIARSYQGKANYPEVDFGRRLKFISQMIVGGVNACVYNISLDGFDTHTLQSRTQAALLKQLSEGLAAFQADLQAHGVDRDVLVLAFTEFGRRVAENSGRGTDHGAAQPVFVMGSSVKAGIHGEHPSLAQLDDGDLKYKIDFRSIYATILDQWMKADSRQILGAQFDKLSFV